jgi:NAD(P)H-dependent FMN reductase
MIDALSIIYNRNDVAHLLHIDSSIQGDRSVSRKLTARAAAAWRKAHPGGTVTYRDLGSDPLPHFDVATGLARAVPPELRTPAQAGSWALSEELITEIKEASTILLGLPLYNFGAPSSVKAWVDHLIAPGLSLDPETTAPCSAAASSSYSPAAVGAMPKAHPVTGGTMRNHGFRTQFRSRAWNRASSPPNSPSPTRTRPWPS